MEGKLLVRLGTIVFVALVVTATAVEMTRKADVPAQESPRRPETARDPLHEAQRRCQQIGEAAAGDPDCLRVWAETRDRFLGRPAGSSRPASVEGR